MQRDQFSFLKAKVPLLQQNKITFSLVQYQILKFSRLKNCPEFCPWTLIGGLSPLLMIIFAMWIFACLMKKLPVILKTLICSTVKKGIFNLAYKQGMLFEKSKQPRNFTPRKTHKSVRKVSKTLNGNEF